MKQIIRLTEDDINNVVKEVIQEIVSEYGTPEQLGAIAARRKLRGDDADEVHRYANAHGAKGMKYYLSYTKWLENHPLDMMKRARNEFHKNK